MEIDIEKNINKAVITKQYLNNIHKISISFNKIFIEKFLMTAIYIKNYYSDYNVDCSFKCNLYLLSHIYIKRKKSAIINFGSLLFRNLKTLISKFFPICEIDSDFIENKNPETIKYIEECDFVVFSGGYKYIQKKDIEPFKKIINTKPVLGICLGSQILAKLHGIERKTPIQENKVTKTQAKVIEDIELPAHSALIPFKFFGKEKKLKYFHMFYVDKNDIEKHKDLEVIETIGKSDMVASFKHKQQPIVAIQGHPESSYTENGFSDYILLKFVNKFVINFDKKIRKKNITYNNSLK